MRLYALINNNVVTEVLALDDSEVSAASAQNQQIIDVEDSHPTPEIGWTLVGNKLEPFESLSQEALEVSLAAKKMKRGTVISSTAIARVGARNKMLAKTAQQITALLSTLSGLKALLETGALGTARDVIAQVKQGYPEYADIFDDATAEINDFESKYGL